MKLERPAELVVIDYRCDKCSEGWMRPTGNMKLCDPPKYPHECTRCGLTEDLLERYPAQGFRILEE